MWSPSTSTISMARSSPTVSTEQPLLWRCLCGAIHLRERSPVGPQRIEQVVDLAADVDRLIGIGNRPRELGVTKRGDRLAALEEVDPTHVTRRIVAAVDLLDQAGHLAEARLAFKQTTVELLHLEAGLNAHEQDGSHSVLQYQECSLPSIPP